MQSFKLNAYYFLECISVHVSILLEQKQCRVEYRKFSFPDLIVNNSLQGAFPGGCRRHFSLLSRAGSLHNSFWWSKSFRYYDSRRKSICRLLALNFPSRLLLLVVLRERSVFSAGWLVQSRAIITSSLHCPSHPQESLALKETVYIENRMCYFSGQTK